jgi:hypothetical protein
MKTFCSVLLALLTSCASAEMLRPTKIVVVVMENTNYEVALSKQFMRRLADQGALFTDYHGLTHPSQPNYIGMIGGSTLGVNTNFNVNLDQSHLGNLIEDAGLSWHVYAEGFPGDCFLGATNGKYARKHVPFVSFRNVQNDPNRCAKITDESTFADDFLTGNLANFSLYVPDLDNDGHDTGADFADDFLDRTFTPLIENTPAMADVLFVLTFDEDSRLFGGDNRIYTVLFGPHVQPGVQISDRQDHYGLLRMIEDTLGLGTLGRNDTLAAPLSGFWR